MADNSKSSLERHKKVGKKLIPPLKQIPNLEFTKWTERLPEYLYAALLTANLSQDEYLRRFRLVVEYFADSEEEFRPEDLSLTSLGKCNEDYLSNALKTLFDTEELKKILRPLLLFKNIPAYSIWKDIIESEPEDDDWKMLKIAIGKTLYHNSQESTDIRWFCVVYMMACGKIVPTKEEQIAELDMVWNYPYEGDLREVRPMIRSIEGSISILLENIGEWVEIFWNTCLSETVAEVFFEREKIKTEIDNELVENLRSAWEKVYKSFYATFQTSSVDPKHDASFGLVAYSLSIVTDSLNRIIGTYLIGRIVLRSLVENYITLAYLVKRDDPELWLRYRDHGSGQAKLVSLKAENYESTPSFISLDDINSICNEDMREEFVDIDLGHWAGSNLRQMSIDSGTKEIYDKYYDWTSGYLHGNWGAVRDSVFLTDFNPLHRLMRVLLPRKNFNDVLPDMIEIMNLQFALLSELYELEEIKI